MKRRYTALIFLISAAAALAYIFIMNRSIQLNLSRVEIADSAEEQRQGLMNRRDLCTDCGMLFVFDEPQPVSFWMKDTPLPLDIIMMDSSGRISDIHRNTKPNDETSLPSSSNRIKYVLEVNAGFAASLKNGQRVNINHLQSLPH